MLSQVPGTQINSDMHKVYASIQSLPITTSASTPLPGVVNTRRPKLTNKQIANRYLQSIAGNPNIDINKIQRKGNDVEPSQTPDQRRHLRNANNCSPGGGGGDGKRSISRISHQAQLAESFADKWQEIGCEAFGASSFGDNVLSSVCMGINNDSTDNAPSQPLSIMITGIAVPVNNAEMKICDPYGTFPVFLEVGVADKALKLQTDITGDPTGGLIQSGITHVLAPENYCEKLQKFNPKTCEILNSDSSVSQINDFLRKNFHSDNGRYFSKNAFDCVIFADDNTMDLWAKQNAQNGIVYTQALAIRRRPEKPIDPFAVFAVAGGAMMAMVGGAIVAVARNSVTNCFQRIKSAICLPREEAPGQEERSLDETEIRIFEEQKARKIKDECEDRAQQEGQTNQVERNSGVAHMDGRDSSNSGSSQAAENDPDESSSAIANVIESDSSSGSARDPGPQLGGDESPV